MKEIRIPKEKWLELQQMILYHLEEELDLEAGETKIEWMELTISFSSVVSRRIVKAEDD